MNILLAAATKLELEPFLTKRNESYTNGANHQVTPLITGVGMTQTTWHLTKYCCNQSVDLIIQAGIAGAFHKDISLGSVYVVENEYFGDLGVEEDHHFFDLFDKKFIVPNTHPFSKIALQNLSIKQYNPIDLPVTNAITVNEITTRPERIEQLKKKYPASLESMEGAALHYLALQMDIPFIQIRAVSNYVGERNKANWKIPLAIANLNAQLNELINSL